MVTTVGVPAADMAAVAVPPQAGGGDQAVAAQFEALLAGEPGGDSAASATIPGSTVGGWRGLGRRLLDEEWSEGTVHERSGRHGETADGDAPVPLGFDLANLLPLLTGTDTRLPAGAMDDAEGSSGPSADVGDTDGVGADGVDAADGALDHPTLGQLVSGVVSERGGLHLGTEREAKDEGLHLGQIERLVAEAIEQADAAVDGGGRRLDIDDANAKAGADAPAAAPTHKHGLPADARPRAEAPDVAARRPNAEATARRVVEPRLGEEGTPGVAPKRLTTTPPPVVLGVHEVTPSQTATPMSHPAVDTSRPAEPLPMADQLVQALRVHWRDGGGEATVTLHPEFLGQVSISLRVEDGRMTAVVRAEESQVRDWIQANVGLLRDRLQEQGLTLHKFEVSDGYQAPNGQPRDERGNGRPVPRSARRQPRTTDTPQAFEVTA